MEITEPVFGASPFNLRKPVTFVYSPKLTPRSVFVGTNNSSTYPQILKYSIDEVLDVYKSRFMELGFPLIINTHGWIKGLGLHIILHVFNNAQCTDIVQMVPEEDQITDISLFQSSNSCVAAKTNLPYAKYHFALGISSTNEKGISAKYVRQLNFAHYFLQRPLVHKEDVSNISKMVIKLPSYRIPFVAWDIIITTGNV